MLSKGKFLWNIPESIMMLENKPYANVIESLMLYMISSRPDLAYFISHLSRLISNPGSDHWAALLWKLNYIRSTVEIGLLYKSGNCFELVTCVGFICVVGTIKPEKVPVEENLADLGAKILPLFKHCLELLNIGCFVFILN